MLKTDEIRNKILCGDCLEILKQLPDKSIDLCLCDPPYGIGEARKKNESRSKLASAKPYPIEDWDDAPPSKEYFDEIRRVSKNQIIFGGNYFTDKLPVSPCWIVWDKDNGDSDFADSELAWTSFKSAVRNFKFRWAGMLQENMACKEVRYHRNQKPVGLLVQIFVEYAGVGDLVLDCFSGSGSTAVACYRTRRDFIGIEISEKYCEDARKRLQAEKDKLGLFPEAQ